MSDITRKKVIIICGSETDLPQVKEVCSDSTIKAKIVVHIMSCHRNPRELKDFIFNRLQEGDMVICVGSKALALPGVVDAWAHCFNKNIRVAGVALGETDSKALLAAQLSIDELPGQPVIMNEMTGQVYTGPSGLRELLHRVDNGEFPPPKPRKEKPAQMDVWTN
jgi:AIR carboxylase